MASFRLELTGGFRLTGAAGEEIRLSSRRSRALIAILALSPGLSATRARLRGLLWGERGEQQAGDSLRQQLAQLRKELGPAADHLLVTRDDQVALSADTIAIDVTAIASGDAGQYLGPLLDGLDVGAAGFEDWLAAQRRDLLARVVALMEKQIESSAGSARLELAERLVALDPLREASHRHLIAAALAAGDRAMAQRSYSACAEILSRELGVAPAPETTALLDRPAATPSFPATPSSPATLPSIVVLPFANLSDAPEQRYFSEGVSADIATELNRFRDAIVRTATKTGSSPEGDDPVVRGRALGVTYVVTGSVRRLGKRLRINVQFIDVEQASQLWSEKFDAAEDEIFDVQDTIVQSISAQLAKVLRGAGVDRAKRKPPASLAAYELVLRAEALQVGDPAAEAAGRELYEQACALDPNYGRAQAGAGYFIMLRWLRDNHAPSSILDLALERTRRAVTLDDNDAFCHLMQAMVLIFRKQLDLALHHIQKALALNPNDPVVLANNGFLHGYRGETERSIFMFEQALVRDPHFNESWYWRDRGVAHFIARQYELAIGGLERSPTELDFVEAYLAASHAYLGNLEKARAHVAALLRLSPEMTIGLFLAREPIARAEDQEHLAAGLRLAGLRD